MKNKKQMILKKKISNNALNNIVLYEYLDNTIQIFYTMHVGKTRDKYLCFV